MNNWEQLEPAVTTQPLPSEFDEAWMNNIYTVFVKRGMETGQPGVTMAYLSIKRNDKEALPDWRHFQYIKNQLVGPNNEGVELYPSESRLIDTCNQYHLWVFEDPAMKFPFGYNGGRWVSRFGLQNSRQRAFPDNMLPHDIDQCEKILKAEMDKEGLK